MIQQFADWLVYGIFGLDAKSHWGSAVNFFFYDTIKIIRVCLLNPNQAHNFICGPSG